MAWTFGSLRAGLNENYQDGKSFLTPDYGSNYERQSFTSTKSIVNGSIVLTYEKYLEFKQFYLDTKQGENKFTYSDCRFGDRLASFFGKWTVTETNGFWVVSLSLLLDSVNYEASVALSYNGCLASYNGKTAGLKVNYEL